MSQPARFPAQAVKDIATALINEHFPHLMCVHIEYLFVDQKTLKGGQQIWAQAQKHTGKVAYLCDVEGPFFSIQVSEPIWNDLSSLQKEALVHHELCHCCVKYTTNKKTGEENETLYIKDHDVQEFVATANRYGTWQDGIKELYKALKHSSHEPTLFDEKK